MLVRMTYLLVIMIWTTTPLAIKLGNDTLLPVVALTLRMLLAVAVGCVIATLFGYGQLKLRSHWPIYFAASVSIFPNMVLVYQASVYLPSGLLALLFGLNPFFIALLAKPILGENLLQPSKLFAITLAIIGLAIIVLDGALLSHESLLGFAYMLLSNLLFSGSALWVKRLNTRIQISAFEQALGSMTFALPGLLLSWYVADGLAAPVFSPISLAMTVHLALVASLIGFVSYYYLLQKLPVDTVALLPLITPVLAIVLGALWAGEVITVNIVIGSALVLIALAIHQGLLKLPSKHVIKRS